MFLHFTQKFKMAAKSGRKTIFGEKLPVNSADILGVKNFALSHTVSEINTILRFKQKFKMAAKNGGKTIFGKSLEYTLQVTWGSKICRNCFISHRFQDKCVFVFYIEIQDGHLWRENDLEKSRQQTLQIPCGSKIVSKLFYLTPFLRY